MKCEVLRLGTVPYETAWKLQEQLAKEISIRKRHPTLLLLEHPHTYTFGRRGDSNNLIWDEAELERRKVAVHWVDRGGDVTYHGPGQLVGYPLLPLSIEKLISREGDSQVRLPQADYVGFIRKLEETIILALSQFKVTGKQIKGLTGVWLEHSNVSPSLPTKIAAIGIKVDSRGVTRHGFAINVSPDMSYWEGIIGCGLRGYPVTCLAEILEHPPSVDEVMDAISDAFGKVFNYQLVHGSST